MADPYWTAERRVMLRGALAKIDAARAHGTRIEMLGHEGALIRKAAGDWEGMMQMLDERAAAGDLKLVR